MPVAAGILVWWKNRHCLTTTLQPQVADE